MTSQEPRREPIQLDAIARHIILHTKPSIAYLRLGDPDPSPSFSAFLLTANPNATLPRSNPTPPAGDADPETGSAVTRENAGFILGGGGVDA